MPIYEYKCKKCNNIFEHFHINSSDPVPPCPKCGDKEAEKIISSGTTRPDGISADPTYSFPEKKLPGI